MITLQATQGPQEVDCAELQLSCTSSAAEELFVTHVWYTLHCVCTTCSLIIHCAVVILDAISCFVDFMKLDDDDGTCGNAANQETFASKRRCSSATWSQKVTKTWINMSTASTIPTHQNCKKWMTITITSIIKTTIPIPIKLWQNLTFATSSASLGVSLVAALNVFPEK